MECILDYISYVLHVAQCILQATLFFLLGNMEVAGSCSTGLARSCAIFAMTLTGHQELRLDTKNSEWRRS